MEVVLNAALLLGGFALLFLMVAVAVLTRDIVWGVADGMLGRVVRWQPVSARAPYLPALARMAAIVLVAGSLPGFLFLEGLLTSSRGDGWRALGWVAVAILGVGLTLLALWWVAAGRLAHRAAARYLRQDMNR
ncbi:MAG: hypothetical protein QM655_10465 [Nocardioidaceae bacterium]